MYPECILMYLKCILHALLHPPTPEICILVHVSRMYPACISHVSSMYLDYH